MDGMHRAAPQTPADRRSHTESQIANPALNGNVLHTNADYVDFIVGIHHVRESSAALQGTEIKGGTHVVLVTASELSPPDESGGPPPQSRPKRKFSEAFNGRRNEEPDGGGEAEEIKNMKPKWSVAKKRVRDEACKIVRLANELDLPFPESQLQPQVAQQRITRRQSALWPS
ncbi:hypothetical protein B0A48_12464 [Cryoendolithus antarcticus]|uniref:Uncharacterized protein n=1 Tax=Cryoendolithus antarcticus TaxID=1507870 RepID=A0A1V8SSK4_9PEZI|nr:hypothetical protein B0A48_12464 [Cryoendolithus antarcticus]